MIRKIMRAICVVWAIAMLSGVFVGARAASDAFSPQARQVIQFMRDRKLAYEKADKAAWGLHVAEKCVFVEDGGRVSVAAEFAEMEGFVGYTMSTEISDVRASDFGETILLTYRQKETRDYGVQKSVGTYVDTETYARVSGEWRLILFTETRVIEEPAIAKIDSRLYDEYVGTYEVNEKATFVVTRDGGKLFGQYSGEAKAELLPASKTRFFVRGNTAAYIFVWDRAGHVVGHVYRAGEGVEVRYKKRMQ